MALLRSPPAYGSTPIRDTANDLGRRTTWLLWQCVRLPLLLLLQTLEPVVSFVLGSMALLGILTAFFWRFFGPPHSPFVLVVSVSLGFAVLRILYHKVLQLLSL
jgi:hypothetical protein